MTVTAKELAEYEFSQQICCECNWRVNKSITAKVKHKKVTYVVECDDFYFTTPSLESAVNEYNKI